MKNTDTTLKSKRKDLASIPWWEQIAGTFADSSAYDEAMRLGREYRLTLRKDLNKKMHS